MELGDNGGLNSSGNDTFLIYWGDILSLLLVFFIFFSSMVSSNSNLEIINKSVKESLNLKIKKELILTFENKTLALNSSYNFIKEYLSEHKLSQFVSLEQTLDSIDFTLQVSLLFTSADDTLMTTSIPILLYLSDLFIRTPGLIYVEGHTDDVPIHTDRFKSNWDLSASRSSSVVSFFENKGVPSDRFVVIGKNSHDSLVPNNSEKNRAINRRVTIKLMVE